MTVFVVMPTFNRPGALGECLAGLAQQTEPVRVVVADTGDGSAVGVAAKRFPQARVLRGPDDLWWTGATNLALRAALAESAPDDWILCLNDDTEMAPDYVARLREAAGRSPRRLAGSVSVDSARPDIVLDGGNRFNWYSAATARLNRGRPLAEFGAGHEETVNVLPGRGTLIPAVAFSEVGLFAERELPHYIADYEFSVRCAAAGYHLVVSYDAVIRSHTSMTGTHRPARRLSLTEARKYFWGQRSSCNLRDRLRFAWMTRRNPLQAALYFTASLARIVVRYMLSRPAAVAST